MSTLSTTGNPRERPRGQSLVEFAIVLPILLALVGGIIQLGALIATNHALIQVGRDVGRWAATQQVDPCGDAATASPPQPATQADAIAQQSGLMGYTAGTWTSAVVHADDAALRAAAPPMEGVEVAWTGVDCPPEDSTEEAWVTVRLSHRAPVLLPGFPYIPGIGTCDGSGCHLALHTIAQFRMEASNAP